MNDAWDALLDQQFQSRLLEAILFLSFLLPEGGRQQPSHSFGRDRQNWTRCSRRSRGGSFGGTRPGAKHVVRGPLPDHPFRPLKRGVGSNSQPSRTNPTAALGQVRDLLLIFLGSLFGFSFLARS